MLDQKPLSRLLFIDIETTSQKESFLELSNRQQHLFLKRFKKEFESQVNVLFTTKYNNELSKRKIGNCEFVHVDKSENTGIKKPHKKKDKILTQEEILEDVKLEVATELYNTKAPIFCEFNRILCISVGVMWKNEGENFYNIKITSFYDEDEKKLLLEFVNHPKLGAVLDRIPNKFEKNRSDYWALVGHNISVFDLPVLSKRMIINGIKPPAIFDVAHLKSWDLADVIIDTKSVWAYNVFDNSTSLDLLCEIFDVPSSKDDIDGGEVKDIFWVEKDLSRIVKYCEKDVLALAQVYLKMKSMTEEVVIYQQAPTNQEEPKEESKEESAEKQDEQSEG